MANAAWSSSFLMLVLAGIVALGLGGLTLLVLGLRGRRINDHPMCRKCRFDLSGVVPAGTKTAGTSRCPECGTALDTPGAIRVGERAKRPIVIVVGVMLLLLSLGSGGYLGFVAFSSPAMNPSKPTTVLRLEARFGNAARAAPALTELGARLSAGTLSDREISALVEEALEIQAHQGQFWLPEWGDLVMTAYSAGKVGAAQLLRYARKAIVIDVECRKLARIDEPIPATLILRGAMSHAAASPAVKVVGTEVEIDDQPPIVGLNQAMMGFAVGGSGSFRFRSSAPTKLGSSKVTFRMRLELRRSFQYNAEPDPSLTWTVEQTKDIEVLTKDRPLVEVLRDDTLAEVFGGKFKVRDVRIDPAAKGAAGTNGFSIMVDSNTLPAPISFEVFLRWPTPGDSQPFLEEKLGEISLPIGGSQSHGLGGGVSRLPKTKLDRATIVLRPSLPAAEHNSSVTKTWLGPDLEFPDTPVLDQRAVEELAPE